MKKVGKRETFFKKDCKRMHEEILRVADDTLVMSDGDYPKEYLAEKKMLYSFNRKGKKIRNSG